MKRTETRSPIYSDEYEYQTASSINAGSKNVPSDAEVVEVDGATRC